MQFKSQYFDLIILGAGITGLSVARQQLLTDSGCKVLIIEKEEKIGLHASGRNSGVLHSGIYYQSDSLKAKFCSEGGQLIAEYCQEFGLPIKRCGKVIVPKTAEEDNYLDLLHKRAELNGAETRIIDKAELNEIEPAAFSATSRALYSPNTSVVDPHSVINKILLNLMNNNVVVAFEEYVTSADPQLSLIRTNKNVVYEYGHLINCTGQYSDLVSKIFNIGKQYYLIPFKGMYYKLKDESQIRLNGLVYPVPDLRIPFLGIHSVKLVNGDIYFGPNSIPALGREHYEGIKGINVKDTIKTSYYLLKQYLDNKDGFRSFAHRELQQISEYSFYTEATKMIPKLKSTDLIKSKKVGIRAQLYNKEKHAFEMDFIIKNQDNITHILNAVSPAFTSAFSFAKYILNRK